MTLCRINNWDAFELADRITTTRADLLYLRLNDEGSGSIPFEHAQTTIGSIYHMIRAAAAAAADPARDPSRGRLPASVEEYLRDDLRLGHTKRGSFVFTVVSRLDRDPGHSPIRRNLSTWMRHGRGRLTERRLLSVRGGLRAG